MHADVVFMTVLLEHQIRLTTCCTCEFKAHPSLAGSSVLAGTSIALAFTLKAKFSGELCTYCAASIAASLALYGVTFANIQDSRKNLSFGSVIATTVLITGLFATYPDTVTASAFSPAHCVTLVVRLPWHGYHHCQRVLLIVFRSLATCVDCHG